MTYDFKLLRPPARYPVYPPYHTGDYLEEYFYKFYIENKQKFDDIGYIYIPVFWTNVYNNDENKHLIQPFLDALPNGKYFTVSQHDDAVKENLPLDTLSFEAGGNGNGIPIPLICSPLNETTLSLQDKDIFCSFVGSVLGPIRDRLYYLYGNDCDIYFSPQHWTNQVAPARLAEFINITKRSIFSLCPRGYGAQSFRLYEVLQLGSIPVFIYDKEWFPFSDDINWSDFCVLINISQVDNLKNILQDISIEQRQQMLEKGKRIYQKYFTLEGTCTQIFNILKKNSPKIQINCITSNFEKKRIETIKKTWGKHCSDLVFYADFSAENILKCTNEPSSIGNEEKTINRIKQIKSNNVYDWYFFVDDDTFVNIENMKKFVSTLNRNNAYGHMTHGYGSEPYFQGGAGFFISKQIFNSIKEETLYIRGSGYGDAVMGAVLRDNNINTVWINNGLLNRFEAKSSESDEFKSAITYHLINTEEKMINYYDLIYKLN